MHSELAKIIKLSPFYNPRTHVIDTITIHCMAGEFTAEKCGEIFQRPGKNASSNYGIDRFGNIGVYVEEENRSWASSNRDNDMRAITIEVSSQPAHPYGVTDTAYNTLIKLLIDICRRYPTIGRLRWKNDKSLIGQVDKQNMTVHRWFATKACPGDFLMNSMDDIVKCVNSALDAGEGGTVTNDNDSTPKNTLYKVQVGAFSKKENAVRLVNELKEKGYNPYIKEEVK